MKDSDVFPLVEQKISDSTSIYKIELKIEEKPRLLLLDTGAVTSSLSLDEQTKFFPVIKEDISIGASGKPIVSQTISVEEIKIGDHIFIKNTLSRSNVDLAGLDLLGTFIFQVDLKNKKLSLLKSIPNETFNLHKLKTGHIIVAAKVSKLNTGALFDTGADTTVINKRFVAENPNLFKWVRKESGTDAHGNKIDSDVYSCNEFWIEDWMLSHVEMATFNFDPHMEEKMEGIPIILGNNVISKAKWAFNLTRLKWSFEKHQS
jgi:hypothetical protein